LDIDSNNWERIGLLQALANFNAKIQGVKKRTAIRSLCVDTIFIEPLNI